MGGLVVSRRSSVVRPGADDGRLTTDDYFCGLAGVAGWVFVCDGLIPCRTEFEPLPPREAMMESVIEVNMKITVDHVVALERTVAEPRGPNAVWLPMPPNAAAMSPLLPLCSSTTMMRKKQTIIWTIVIRIIMPVPQSPYARKTSIGEE